MSRHYASEAAQPFVAPSDSDFVLRAIQSGSTIAKAWRCSALNSFSASTAYPPLDPPENSTNPPPDFSQTQPLDFSCSGCRTGKPLSSVAEKAKVALSALNRGGIGGDFWGMALQSPRARQKPKIRTLRSGIALDSKFTKCQRGIVRGRCRGAFRHVCHLE